MPKDSIAPPAMSGGSVRQELVYRRIRNRRVTRGGVARDAAPRPSPRTGSSACGTSTPAEKSGRPLGSPLRNQGRSRSASAGKDCSTVEIDSLAQRSNSIEASSACGTYGAAAIARRERRGRASKLAVALQSEFYPKGAERCSCTSCHFVPRFSQIPVWRKSKSVVLPSLAFSYK